MFKATEPLAAVVTDTVIYLSSVKTIPQCKQQYSTPFPPVLLSHSTKMSINISECKVLCSCLDIINSSGKKKTGVEKAGEDLKNT